MSVRIKILSDLDAKGLKEAEQGLAKLGQINDRVFKTMAAGAGLAAIGFAKFANDSIRQASNLEESTNAVNVAFGESAKAVLAIGESSARSLGLAQNEFNQAAVRFSAFAERIVGVGEDTSGFIQSITQRASDFASVFNIEVAEALQVFQSGLAGEAEPLKRFGINLLQSEVQAYALRAGILAVGEQMTETQKVQARYGLLLESTAKTAGDFANTSEGLANSQRILKAEFTDLQAQIGSALLPAFTDLVKAVADALMPRLEELSRFLNSPQGQKQIQQFADSVVRLGEAFLDSIDTIVRFGGVLLVLSGSVKAVTGALALARTAQLLFNLAVSVNPYVLAVTALVALATTMTAFAGNADKAKLSAQRQSYQVTILEGEIRKLNESFKSGAIDQQTYETQLRAMEQQLNSVKISTEGTAGEINRFNALRLDGAIASMEAYKNATSLAERQAKTFANSYSYLESIGAVTPRTPTEGATSFADAVVNTGPSAFEQARKKVQDLIQSSQKQLRDAQKTLVRSQIAAREDYAQNILRIEKDFAQRFENIVKQSQDRLRNAFRSAIETNIAGLFEQDENRSVEGLVKSLSDRLAGSRQLLANSAELASQGFSQTFIEQVVGAGVETGNELASAILNSTPEVRTELKGLFTAIEREASSGMDSLANQIFQDQGLATDELKMLFLNTQVELVDAMLEQQRALDLSLSDANNAFLDAVTTIKDAVRDQVAEMGEELGGLGGTVDQFIGKLDALIAKYRELKTAQDTVPEVAPPTISFLPDMPTGGISFLPIDPGVSTGAMPAPVINQFPQMPLRQVGLGSPTIINITAKADTSQSLAMVGKSLGNTVAKYVTGGGQVIVSNV